MKSGACLDKEINHFQQRWYEVQLSEDLRNRLNAAKPSMHINQLQENDNLLNDINTEIITTKINVNATKSDISNCNITRIPSALFEDPAYTVFWRALKSLNLQQPA